ncbi:MAG: phosphopantothenoylcysteine decarboxylase, partial [Bradyrhizobium sp.]
NKIKKDKEAAAPTIRLVENPDILATLARHRQRPHLLIGFAAETENVAANARDKLKRKGADWILANDVSPQTGIMGGDSNTIELVTAGGVEPWPPQSKDDVARMLIERIASELAKP